MEILEKKIGIDLDKTLLSCDSFIYAMLNKLNFNKGKNLKYREINPNGIYKSKFVNKIFKFLNPNKYSPYLDAVRIINDLHQKGYEIYFVSNRPSLKPIISMTINCLKNLGVEYDKLILGCNNKADLIRKEGINYFIDDVAYICNKIFLTTDAKPIWFTPLLKDEKKPKYKLSNFKSFNSWKSIGGYFNNELKKYEDESKQKYKLSHVQNISFCQNISDRYIFYTTNLENVKNEDKEDVFDNKKEKIKSF